MATDLPPLDYRSPQISRRPVFSVPVFLACSLVAAVLLVDLLVIAPMFRVVFLDFAILQPKVTEWLLLLSRAARKGGWALIVVLPVVAGFLAATIPPPPPATSAGDRPRLRRMSRLALLPLIAIAIATIVLLTVVALFLPLLKLIEVTVGR
jgi:type II secretory pathway component PulF